MRLWHEDIIEKLPRQQLLGQHRECCALRGNGWGKPHSVVNYVFNHTLKELEQYHRIVMSEMQKRGYKVSKEWELTNYRGKNIVTTVGGYIQVPTHKVYQEHNDRYYQECIDNLKGKGIYL